MELSCEQTIRSRGVCEPALEPRGEWEGSETRGQDFKPDLGNPAVRHYRGAFENVAMVEMRTQLAIERAGLVTLHLQPARRSSIPTRTPPRQAGEVVGVNAWFHQLTGKIRVTCHSGVLRKHRCWANEDVREGRKNAWASLRRGRCVGRICPDYLKFSTRTMSLLNASSCV